MQLHTASGIYFKDKFTAEVLLAEIPALVRIISNKMQL